jgi:hypothetical protein
MYQTTSKVEESMQYWTTLNQAIEANLEAGQIGQPVFVRCTATMVESAEMMKDQLAEMIYYVNGWFSSSVCRVYALGAQVQSHLATSLEYRSGGTALLVLALNHNQPQVDLIVLGSSGAIYHRELVQPARDSLLSPKVTDQVQKIMIAVDQSLATGKPVNL